MNNSIIPIGRGAEILIYIYENENPFMNEMSYKIKMTYAHLSDLINGLEEKGFVSCKKDGRKKTLDLTPKGKELAELFLKIDKLLKGKR